MKMEDFEWTFENEIKLFESMSGTKPVGLIKHFGMICIWEKLQEREIDLPVSTIWDYLKTLFNMEAIEEIEDIAIPTDQKEFFLPEVDFGSMKYEKLEDKTSKPTLTKRNENKELVKLVTVKEEKSVGKKDNQRRDSKEGKDGKHPIVIKKEIKKEPEKSKPSKSRLYVTVKEEEKTRTPTRSEEALKRQNKRPTRGSLKPDESSRLKSQSPLPVPSSSKRRRTCN